MTNHVRQLFFSKLEERLGRLTALPNSRSLFLASEHNICIYLRYSKRHSNGRTFYGLRRQDLKQLEGHASFICLLWDDQLEPLIIPYHIYEDLFNTVSPAADGQYKTQVIINDNAIELYVASAGRFNVESYIGWQELDKSTERNVEIVPPLSHSQVQTLIGAIGALKGFQVWIPRNDRSRIGFDGVAKFDILNSLPSEYASINSIAEQVDAIWVERGSGQIQSLFEVEHSTTIYSGLLRFNDILLTAPDRKPNYSIVAEDVKRGRFARQLQRPTFKASGLHDGCSFLEYDEVFGWYGRLSDKIQG